MGPAPELPAAATELSISAFAATACEKKLQFETTLFRPVALDLPLAARRVPHSGEPTAQGPRQAAPRVLHCRELFVRGSL